MNVRFVKYFEERPTHHSALFEVTGHGVIPNGSLVGWGVLRAFNIQPPPFEVPSYWEWRQKEFQQRLKIAKFLRGEIL